MVRGKHYLSNFTTYFIDCCILTKTSFLGSKIRI